MKVKTVNISREEKKIEAIKRMKMLKIFPGTINQFEKDDLVSISEPPNGHYFLLSDKERALADKLEEKYGILIYTAIRSGSLGPFISFLFVSDDKDEWWMEQRDVQYKEPIAYVYNTEDPEMSEFGSISIAQSIGGGLLRIW